MSNSLKQPVNEVGAVVGIDARWCRRMLFFMILACSLWALPFLASPAVAQSYSTPVRLVQVLPPAVDMGAVTGALKDDGKDKPTKATGPAGPRRSAEDIRREAADAKAWQEVRLAAKAGEAENPLQAIDAYKKFFGSRPLHPTVGASVTAVIAELYVRQQDAANATRIYEWADKEYAGLPASARLIPGRAGLLNLQKKPDEAATLLRGNWDAVMGEAMLDASLAESALKEMVATARARKKSDSAIEMLQNAMAQVPVLSGGSKEGIWAYETLVDLLFEAKRGQEAVGVARLRFMECGFDKYNIEAASVFLTRVWRRHDPTGKEVEAFATAQAVAASDDDGKKANPLFGYPIPRVTDAVWQGALAKLPVNSTRMRINVFIAAGEFGTAMQEAEAFHAQYSENGGAAATVGIIEACRVLKAADLNLVRSNALLSFLKTKQGENPLPEFYKQYPPRPVADATATSSSGEGSND